MTSQKTPNFPTVMREWHGNNKGEELGWTVGLTAIGCQDFCAFSCLPSRSSYCNADFGLSLSKASTTNVDYQRFAVGNASNGDLPRIIYCPYNIETQKFLGLGISSSL